MQHVSTPAFTRFSSYARREALLLALGAAGPAAWGQSFGPVSNYSAGASSRPFGVALGDVNGDGRPDIVSAIFFSATAGVLLGQAGGFLPVTTYPVNAGNAYAVAVSDLNGDNRLDIVTANYGGDNVSVLSGQTGGFAPFTMYSTGAGSLPVSVALGDVNGDGRVDIVTANNNTDPSNNTTSTVGVILGLAAGGFAPSSNYFTGTSSRPQGVALGDVNRDGRLDIITANLSTSNVGVLLGVAGGFAPVSNYFIGTNTSPVSVALGDLNNDGRLDIVTANGSGDNVGVLLGSNGGGFATASVYPSGTGSRPYGIALGDVNGDGRLDIVTGNAGTNTVGVLLGVAGGGFATASTAYSVGAGSTPQGVALGDVNSDGRLDIVSANYGSSTIGVFLNTGTYTPLATAHPTAAEITLAPNPARDAFTVQLPAGIAPTQAELLNALGQVVRHFVPAAGASFSMATTGLAPGLYTLRLQAGGATLAKRVVVE
jgi:hypothetical protein